MVAILLSLELIYSTFRTYLQFKLANLTKQINLEILRNQNHKQLWLWRENNKDNEEKIHPTTKKMFQSQLSYY